MDTLFWLKRVWVALSLFISCVFVASCNQNDGRWEELSKVAVIAGSPLVNDPQLSSRDYNEEAARFLAFHNSDRLEINDPELVKIWAQIKTDADRGLLILQRISNLDKNEPSWVGAGAKVWLGDDKASRDGLSEFVNILGTEGDKSLLRKQFREAETSLNVSIASLQQIADGLPAKELPTMVSVRYLPSWEGTYQSDQIEIQNTSDSEMQNATVIVTVRMNDGSSKIHVHYVNHWQSGLWLKALYPYRNTDYASAQTGMHPENVDVAVYLRSGTARATYALTPETWDQIVKDYCSHITFSGEYLKPFPGAEELDHHAGFQFKFQGVSTLPVESVEVRFTSSTGNVQSVKERYPPGTKFPSGEYYPVRSQDLDGDDPSHIDYIMKFFGTNYQHEMHQY